MPTSERVAELIRAYADGPRLLDEALRGLSTEDLHFTPGPEHWSIHENVIHLVDTDLVAAARMRYVLAEPGATLVGFDPGRWAQGMAYAAQPFDAARALFRAVRESTAALLSRIPEPAWDQAGMHTESGAQTLEYIVQYYVEHVQYHLRTIAKRRRQLAER